MGSSGSQAVMDATGPCGFPLSYHLSFVHWCLLQDTPQEDSEVGGGMEISLLHALSSLFSEFSSRCSGALASREMGENQCLSVAGKGLG